MNNNNERRHTREVLTMDKVRERVIVNALKTGKDSFPPTSMGIAFTQAALKG